MTPPRRSLLAGAPNFRDLGGLPTADGRHLRHGRLYRSGALDELDDADLSVLGGLRIGVCLDVRSASERQQHPSRWPANAVPQTLAIEVATDIRALDREASRNLVEHPDADGAARLIRAVYRNMPDSCAPVLRAVIEALTGPQVAPPLVIHCTAGKDRTGFVVALLLTALGVAMPDIEADYLVTNQFYDATRQDAKIVRLLKDVYGVELDAVALRAITDARVDYLREAFEAVRQRWGTTWRYLEQMAGLSAERRERLCESLLE